jgi:acyl transferase domain-containing protein
VTASTRRYVVPLSTRDLDPLITQARVLADYLDHSRGDRRRSVFADTIRLPSVVATLMSREQHACRVAFSADSLSETVTRLHTVVAESGDWKRLQRMKIHLNVADTGKFAEELAEDRAYLERLLAGGRYDRVAALWTLGFPIDWRAVYPELADEPPIYLPPTRSARQRFWPQATDLLPVLPDSPEPGAVRALESTPVSTAGSAGIAAMAEPMAVAPTAGSAPSAALALAELPATVRRQRLRRLLQRYIAETLGYLTGELPPVDVGFFDLGMTSVHLAQVQSMITKTLGFAPSVSSGFDYPTVAAFADYLESSIDFAALTSAAAVGGQPTPDDDPGGSLLAGLNDESINNLSPVELERVLSQILK